MTDIVVVVVGFNCTSFYKDISTTACSMTVNVNKRFDLDPFNRKNCEPDQSGRKSIFRMSDFATKLPFTIQISVSIKYVEIN